jgi:hypothetical protein
VGLNHVSSSPTRRRGLPTSTAVIPKATARAPVAWRQTLRATSQASMEGYYVAGEIMRASPIVDSNSPTLVGPASPRPRHQHPHWLPRLVDGQYCPDLVKDDDGLDKPEQVEVARWQC